MISARSNTTMPAPLTPVMPPSSPLSVPSLPVVPELSVWVVSTNLCCDCASPENDASKSESSVSSVVELVTALDVEAVATTSGEGEVVGVGCGITARMSPSSSTEKDAPLSAAPYSAMPVPVTRMAQRCAVMARHADLDRDGGAAATGAHDGLCNQSTVVGHLTRAVGRSQARASRDREARDEDEGGGGKAVSRRDAPVNVIVKVAPSAAVTCRLWPTPASPGTASNPEPLKYWFHPASKLGAAVALAVALLGCDGAYMICGAVSSTVRLKVVRAAMHSQRLRGTSRGGLD